MELTHLGIIVIISSFKQETKQDTKGKENHKSKNENGLQENLCSKIGCQIKWSLITLQY